MRLFPEYKKRIPFVNVVVFAREYFHEKAGHRISMCMKLTTNEKKMSAVFTKHINLITTIAHASDAENI